MYCKKNTFGARPSSNFSMSDLQFAVVILQNLVGALIIINLNKFVPNVTFLLVGFFLCGVQIWLLNVTFLVGRYTSWSG